MSTYFFNREVFMCTRLRFVRSEARQIVESPLHTYDKFYSAVSGIG